MAAPRLQSVRLSAHQAASELGVTTNKVKWALKAKAIQPGKDDRFSLKDIFIAMSPDSLKSKAEEMRWEGVIAEAELKKMRVAEARGELVPLEVVFKTFLDSYTAYVQRVKHFTTLSKAEKEDLINAISPLGKAPATKSISPSNNGA